MARVRNDAGIAEFVALTEHKQRDLLLEYANNGGRLHKACKTIGMNPIQHHRWKRTDENYAKAFDIAEDMSVDVLLDAMKEVVVEPQTKGKPLPNIISGMFLIKAKRSEYKDNFIANSQAGPVSINFTFAPKLAEKDITPTQETITHDLNMTKQED
jgi:hypothetical protein